MRRLSVFALVLVAACGGSGITTPPKKLDPYLTIRVRDLMDTTTAPGRAHWHMYALLTGPYTSLNGISPQGSIGLNDLRLGHNLGCVSVSADSVGQRLLAVVALADTTTENLTPDALFNNQIALWYAGNLTMPVGWDVLFFVSQDAWNSAQFKAGHGLTSSDPIKWGFDWTARGTTTFYERTDTDPTCATS